MHICTEVNWIMIYSNIFTLVVITENFVDFLLKMQISIKTLTGRQQTFTFDPETHVRLVKQALQEKEGIEADQIRLIYSGKQLANDKSLKFYNVKAGEVIHMVLQLRGGN